jgi:predicted ATPase
MSSSSDDRRERLRQKITLPSDNRIYGRSGEESILINSYYASLTLNQNSPANLTLICGDSGLGKTKLAEVLHSYAKEDDGFFIRGKFEQSSASGAANVPYAGITNAFREYCSLLEERRDDREEVVRALKREIHENDGSGSLICEAIPSLRKIIQDTCSEECVDELASTKNRFHRLKYLLKKFIRVISSRGDPIIFLLDDMQV